MSAPIKILLGPTASAALTATGESAFAIIGKASWPEDSSRWILHLVPLPLDRAQDACLVATGEATAKRKRDTTG